MGDNDVTSEQIVDLSERAGFPLLFNPDTLGVSFGSEMAETLYSSRRVEAMRPVLKDPMAIEGSPAILYHMYRHVHYPGMSLREQGYRYDLSVFTHGMLGDEYLKSLGHYHPLIPRRDCSYPEMYEVLYGAATFLLQKVSRTHPAVVEDFMCCDVAAGDKIIVPPDYGHVTVNRGTLPLITTNWVSDNFSSIYQPVAHMRGFAWYLTTDGWRRNTCYEGVSNRRDVRSVWSAFDHLTLFELGLKHPSNLSMLEDPSAFHFNHFRDVMD